MPPGWLYVQSILFDDSLPRGNVIAIAVKVKLVVDDRASLAGADFGYRKFLNVSQSGI